MKTGNLFKILLLIIFATTFVACESEEKDGDWEAMKWETNVSNINKNKNVTKVSVVEFYGFMYICARNCNSVVYMLS